MFLSVAPTPKHQTDSLFAREQLRKLYLYHSKEDVFPSIARSPEGKPYFVSSSQNAPHPWHFNLSHSKGWVAVALDTQPVGIDVQVFRPVSEKLVARVCSDKERQWLCSLPSTKQQQGFAFLWCGKEAIFKASGRGIGSGKKLAEVSLEPSYVPSQTSLISLTSLIPLTSLTSLIPLTSLISLQSLDPQSLDPSPLPVSDVSILTQESHQTTSLARRLTPHFALAVCGKGVTGF